MSAQTILLVKVLSGILCLLLALIPAQIGKRKGYHFSTYYAFGVASFLLAFIVALAVRPREERSLDEDYTSFRRGNAALYTALTLAILYSLGFLYYLFIRNSLMQLLANDSAANLLFALLSYSLPLILSVWAFVGGLLCAKKAQTHQKAFLITLLSLLAFAVITLALNFSYLFRNFSDGVDLYYFMPFAVGLYALTLVFALANKDRTVSIVSAIAGIVCAVVYQMLFIILITGGTFNARVLLSMVTSGTLLWSLAIIALFVAILNKLPKKNASAQYAFAGSADASLTQQPQTEAPSSPAAVVPGKSAGLPKIVVFACESANAAAMAMFGNTAEYFTPSYCISRVRANFQLSAEARVDYVARAEWKGPVPVLVGEQFEVDLPLVQRLEEAYLVEHYGLSAAAASAAVRGAQAMQAPKLGLLWLCVSIVNA